MLKHLLFFKSVSYSLNYVLKEQLIHYLYRTYTDVINNIDLQNKLIFQQKQLSFPQKVRFAIG